MKLVILGEGPERGMLESLARELGVESRVRMPGYAENPYAYMARASVFVLSSAWEGLPTALIEALAVGTPVVSTDCPGGSREILADGEFGQLVPVGEPSSLARAIRLVLDQSPEGYCLRERARRFSVERAADEYLSLLIDRGGGHMRSSVAPPGPYEYGTGVSGDAFEHRAFLRASQPTPSASPPPSRNLLVPVRGSNVTRTSTFSGLHHPANAEA